MEPGHNYPALEGHATYGWLQHAAADSVPLDQLPTAPGPIIYEGFVPQRSRQQTRHVSSYADGRLHSQSISTNNNHHKSQYPPLDDDDDDDDNHEGMGGIEASITRPSSSDYRLSDLNAGFSSNIRPSHTVLRNVPSAWSEIETDEMTLDEETDVMDFTDLETGSLERSAHAAGRGVRRGRRGGSGRGPGRPRRGEGRRGGWGKGKRRGVRPVLDPGIEFVTLHQQATEAFLDRQDHEMALELILKAIAINPEMHSAHLLLSDIYFAKHDEERGLAALFSGAHASPNDPDVWHQIAQVCVQRSTTSDRSMSLKRANYCFSRLLQIDPHDHQARLQKIDISLELGYQAKALKDIEYLLQATPHNFNVLHRMADICLEINDGGRVMGLYDDAFNYHRLNDSADHGGFTWDDLRLYVNVVVRCDGISGAIQSLKDKARWLMEREDEYFWSNYTQDDREWDADNMPRRLEISQFQPGLHSADRYGIGLPLELRVTLGALRLQHGSRQEALNHFEWLAPDDRSEGAPLYDYPTLFLDAATALQEVKEFEQALRYYEALYAVNAFDHFDFWLGIGACSYVCKKPEQALYCYEQAKDSDATSAEARTQLAKLFAARGEREKALIMARSAITLYEKQLPRTQRRRYERKDLREAREAAQNIYREAYKLPRSTEEVADLPAPRFSRRARGRARRQAQEAAQQAVGSEPDDHFETDSHAASHTPLRKQESLRGREAAIQRKTRQLLKVKSTQDQYDNIQQLYQTLCEVTVAMREEDDAARNIWMDCAEGLIEKFRTERAFYPNERYMKFQGYGPIQRRVVPPTFESDYNESERDIPVPSIESALIPQDYCGIHFTSWLDLFLEYAMLLANSQEDTEECYAVIKAALDCNVWYHDPAAMFQIHVCWLACALVLRDEDTLFNTVIRWFMREFLFCTDMYRLFGALNLYFPHSNDKAGKVGQMNNALFRAGASQKFLFRQVVAMDYQLPEDYGVGSTDGPVPEFMRKPPSYMRYRRQSFHNQNERDIHDHHPSRVQKKTIVDDDDSHTSTPSTPSDGNEENDDGDEPVPTRTYTPRELDVVLLVLYAQVLYAGGSFPNALSYFYRALSLDPKNALVLFSIALCYMHQLLKRQNENRHMYLLQAWSFFEEYADARTAWAMAQEATGQAAGVLLTVKREIEFNRARCWQMLGLSDLGMRSLETVLDMRSVKTEDEMETGNGSSSEKNKKVESFSMEAAYAMMTTYAMNGDIDRAKQITEKYLVVE